MEIKIVYMDRGQITKIEQLKPFLVQYIDGDLVDGIERPYKHYIHQPGWKPACTWEVLCH